MARSRGTHHIVSSFSLSLILTLLLPALCSLSAAAHSSLHAAQEVAAQEVAAFTASQFSHLMETERLFPVLWCAGKCFNSWLSK